jgi:hypothetical protein
MATEISVILETMLNFLDFFTACTGIWKTERIYHSILQGEIERSYTQYQVTPLADEQKQQMLSSSLGGLKVDTALLQSQEAICPGFAIAFDTVSETGEQVSMSLKALFIPDAYAIDDNSLPVAATALSRSNFPHRGGNSRLLSAG